MAVYNPHRNDEKFPDANLSALLKKALATKNKEILADMHKVIKQFFSKGHNYAYLEQFKNLSLQKETNKLIQDIVKEVGASDPKYKLELGGISAYGLLLGEIIEYGSSKTLKHLTEEFKNMIGTSLDSCKDKQTLRECSMHIDSIFNSGYGPHDSRVSKLFNEISKEHSTSTSVSPDLITLLRKLLDSKNSQVEKIVKKRFEYTIDQELSKHPTPEAKLSCIKSVKMAFNLPHESRPDRLSKLCNETILKYKNEDWFKLPDIDLSPIVEVGVSAEFESAPAA